MPAPATSAPSSVHTRDRILQQARGEFFAHGYSRFNMDELAAELGMSKKTLYVHFAGKDEIISAVLDDFAAEIRREGEKLSRDRTLNLAEKLRAFAETMVEKLGALQPGTVRDLQRFAPKLFLKVEELRRANLPYIFGRFVEEGQNSGLVRENVSPSFAVEFFLHAMQGLMHPAALERLRLPPSQVIPTAIDLFFGGLLTPAGRKQYEKLFPR
jgi:AcrR family transcriptional regulator